MCSVVAVGSVMFVPGSVGQYHDGREGGKLRIPRSYLGLQARYQFS